MDDKENITLRNFIREIVEHDLETGKHKEVVTRFPPEPNGYLHIGHAKAICLDFGIAREFGGRCHLRFDDTNPEKEDEEYEKAIIEDVRWLGFDWGEHLYYASDYFGRLYEFAVELIKKGKAYVCELSPEEIRETRGTLTEPGKESPYRNRPPEESLELFNRMRNGEFEEGRMVLRAKIDMAHPNLCMRDPVIYRIKKEPHPRTGSEWCIYPMYDFAHCLSDSIEGITHSLCTLEFEEHRPLYDWFLEVLDVPCRPRQIEFARLNLSYTIMSKRKLLELVRGGHVDGWDDPRMPTLSGLRRRGYTPESIRNFCERIGVARKRDTLVDVAYLEHAAREDLNRKAQRRMAVLEPLKVILENYPEDLEEEFEIENNPEDPSQGTRKVPFSREIYIEKNDFKEDPPPKYFRLAPGKEVRLKQAYVIKCKGYEKDENGEVRRLICEVDLESRGGTPKDGRRIKGTVHWVSARHCFKAEVRLYDRLFTVENPLGREGRDFKEFLNPKSLVVLKDCMLEESLKDAEPGSRFQFLRHGYFCVDTKYSGPGSPVFNLVVPLKDTWAKIEKKLNK